MTDEQAKPEAKTKKKAAPKTKGAAPESAKAKPERYDFEKWWKR